ncbi:SUMF1/EgtB/PvdO family nonheme iron enzyme [Devosia elaeis]|uniref:Sulfatase-modifying factor enzyme-like domain-containing protein n=1 Tax=Devosia elaeis TaxID=1770058 RepID=A0A178HNY8_9HYPH|nr:SUMF1/EgtB/PvdO family nonheme iron enzyme [Devosia elaeis]OAM73778.1 hypothetical protein A3840_17440 [Devosia elaeis]
MGVTISTPDALRQSVEAASGGVNTVLYDAKGYPSIMCVVPRFNVEDIDPGLGSGVHPAFVVGGVQKSEIFIGKFQAVLHDDHALSLPGQDPQANINFTASDAACAIKGPGWHMMTNAEFVAVALWCWKNGFQPRGNTNWGRHHDQTYEVGRRTDGHAPGVSEGHGRVLTGSGPVSWFHDNSPAGIADLCGNVWEWVRGLRLVDGEIQIIPDNNAAVTDIDHSPGSDLWRAILQDGTLVNPGTANTLKYDASNANGSGNPILSTSVTNQSDGDTSTSQPFSAMATASGVSAPNLAKLLGLFPHDGDVEGRHYARNVGERVPLRGGGRADGAYAGAFALHLSNERSSVSTAVGIRPAFVL